MTLSFLIEFSLLKVKYFECIVPVRVEYVENVQCLGTRMTVGLNERRLATRRLQTLADRRLRGDVILVFSIMTGSSDLPLEDFLTRTSVVDLRDHRCKLYHWRFRLNRHGSAFSGINFRHPWHLILTH